MSIIHYLLDKVNDTWLYVQNFVMENTGRICLVSKKNNLLIHY